MATPNPYFLYPFCSSGGSSDLTAIPNTGTDSGSVNYPYGFTPNYELASTDPTSLPVPRQQFNQLMLDITTAIQQLQTQGYPLWIASGSGGPTNYPIYATVAYNAGSGIQIWQSVVGSNTSTPGADNNWVPVSFPIQTTPPGTVIDFASPNVPTGYLWCNGTEISRTTYANLLIALTQVQSCTLSSNTSVVVFSSSTLYVGMAVEGSGIQALTTIADIVDGTHITLSLAATSSGPSDLTFFYWGNGDGSTTFKLPDLRGKISKGAFGSKVSGTNGIGNVPGQIGGGDTYTLGLTDIPNHTHDGTLSLYTISGPNPYQVSGIKGSLLSSTFSYTTGNISTYSSQTAIPMVPNAAILLKCIKY